MNKPLESRKLNLAVEIDSDLLTTALAHNYGISRYFLGLLALFVGLVGPRALGQGSTPQSLNWPVNVDAVLSLNAPLPFTVTASSGLPVTVWVEAGPATVGADTITVTSRGTVWVTAEQAGDTTFQPVRETRSLNRRLANFTPSGRYDTSGEAHAVQVVGNYAYVADFGVGLQVFEVSDPSNPRRIGVYNTSGEAVNLQIVGNYAYVADSGAGLQVINVSDPAHPARLGGFNTSGIANAVDVVGSYAYVADGDASLQIIDVSNPASPTRVGGYALGGHVAGVRVIGSYAYLATGGAGLEVLDVSDPTNPVPMGELDTGGALDLQVVGNYAYVANYRSLEVVDVSIPNRPMRVSGINTDHEARRVQVVGNYAYVADGNYGLKVIDVGNPTSLQIVGRVNTEGQAYDVHVIGGHAYVANLFDFRIYDLELGYPQTFTWQGNTNAVLSLNTRHPLAVVSSSGLPVTLRLEAGPATIAEGTITITNVGTVVVTAEQSGDETYLPGQETRRFNVRQAELTAVTEVRGFESAIDVQVVGHYAYVADWNAGLQVIDVSDSARPVRVGRYEAAGQAHSLAVVGNYAYLAANAAGLQVIDVSNPANPVRVGGFNTSGLAYDVHVVDNFAYVADGESGLQVINVSDPARPVRVGGSNTESLAKGVWVDGKYAYVADDDTLIVIDVSNPARPVRVGGYDAKVPAQSVQVEGIYAYVAGSWGIEVVDVSNPASPTFVGIYNSAEYASSGVKVVGNYAYLADGATGLQVIDLSYPASPKRVGGIDTRSNPIAVQVVGSNVYVAGATAGFQVFHLELGYPQTLTWKGKSKLELNTPHPLSVTANTGLPVVLRVDAGPATIVDGLMTVTGAGTVVVSAEQFGDAIYLPIRETRGFNVPQVQFTPVGEVDTGGSAWVVQVVGNYAYVADNIAGLQVIDVSHPGRPVRVGGVTLGSATDVQVVGNYAYMTFFSNSSQVIDVSNPASPVPVGTLFNGSRAWAVKVVGNLAFVAASENGLRVIDVSNPASPVQVGSINTGGIAWDVEVVGNYAYVAAAVEGLEVIEVSNPAVPVRVGKVDTRGTARFVQVSGNYAYVATLEAGLEVIDVSDPAHPVRVGGTDRGSLRAATLEGGYAFLSARQDGLEVFDVSYPASPVRVGGYDTDSSAVGVHAVGNYAYVADYEAGLKILELRLGYPQELEWQLDEEVPFQSQPLTSPAMTDSRLPLTFSVVSGPARIVENQIVLTNVGLVTLRVEQAGDETYFPVSADQTFAVTPPRLGVRWAGEQVNLFWVSGIAGLKLQWRDSLLPESEWQDVTSTVAEAAGESRVALETSGTQHYFRLLY